MVSRCIARALLPLTAEVPAQPDISPTDRKKIAMKPKFAALNLTLCRTILRMRETAGHLPIKFAAAKRIPVKMGCSTLLLGLTLGWVNMAIAQEGGGIIVGRVDDQSGASVVSADVKVFSTQRKETIALKTNGNGSFTTPSLPIGSYSILVSSQGFQPERREGIEVQVDAHLQVNFSLKPGSATEAVSVTAEDNQVNTSSSELGMVITNRSIQELAVNGRSVLALTQLTPGVTSNAGQINEGFVDRGTLVSSVSINNGPNAANAVLIDGQSILQTYTGEVSLNPAANAIQEFKIESGNISAEYGFTAGGVISMVSASGSDKYHGQVYEFLRNDALDARNYFNAYPQAADELRFNQYGGSIGGPIRTRTTFFGNYEEYRYLDGNVVITSVPTDEWRQGNFSHYYDTSGKLIPIYDPSTTAVNPSGNGYVRRQFQGNIIPKSQLDPVAQAVNAFYPEPNCTPTNQATQANNYCGPGENSRWMRQYLARVDHTFSSRHSMFVRYAYYKAYTDSGASSSGGLYSKIEPFLGLRYDNYPNHGGIIEDTFVISPTFLNEARLSVLRTDFTFVTSSYGGNWPQKLGMPNVPNTTFPRMTNGFTTSSTSAVGERAATNPTFSDIVTLVRGKHSLRFGGEWRINRGYNKQTAEPSGVYTFNAALTGNPQSPTGTGYAYASFMLGAVASAVVDTVEGESEANYSLSGFVQDSWKVNRRLVLNLGARYDFQKYPREQNNGLSNFDINAMDPLGLKGAMVYAGLNGQPASPRASDLKNFAPRIGFAWDIFGNGHSSLRGGYGIYYPTIFTTDFFGSTTGFASTVTNYSAPGGNTNYAAMYLQNGLPSAPIQPLGAKLGPDGLLGQSVTYDQYSNGVTPMSQQWNLAYEQALPSKIIVNAAYVGNHGSHFVAGSYSLNQLNPSYLSLGSQLQNPVPNPYVGIVPGALGAATITKQQSLLPFPYYQGVSMRMPHDGNFIGHALQLSATKHTTHGLTIILSYTKSKLIDDSISTPGVFGPVDVQAASDTYQNSYNRKAERSIDPLDRSQNLHVSGLYDLPFGRGRTFAANIGPWTNRLVGGWQLNTITQWHTGTPLTITGANNFAATRPNFVPGISAKLSHPSAKEWFNTAAFINPANYTFGNVPRTLPNVRGPSATNSDISLIKTTSITERIRSEFRVEAFNAFNHPILGLPNMTFSPGSNGLNSSGTFGTITSATDGREIQLALKLLF
jgi:hypothetical protein